MTKRFLVTAGNTREKLDSVRDWGNIFTGNTGLAIAKALCEFGEVDLLTSNRAHAAEIAARMALPIHVSTFTSHAELRDVLHAAMQRNVYDAVFMTAAVADYRPVRVFQVIDRTPAADGSETWRVRDVQAGKVKSNHPSIAVLGEQTEKLIDLFRKQWNHKGLLVKFKLEVGISTEKLIEIGQASRRASGAEYLVANTLDMLEGDGAGAYLLSDSGHEFVPREQLAMRLVKLVQPAKQ